ncbi:DMT family transporter [Roseiconus lacunae]|uniref:DMT family transporter n=1 Tax=Roseiconus lacunae TaxID=2605694 RepID=UPI00308A6F82|nr:DMT family transporter [Stieleria sp. HD01]
MWLGPACGLASAVLYTLTNIALRKCVDVDPYLVSAVKAAPTVAVLGPLLCWNRWVGSSTAATERPFEQLTALRLGRFIGASFLAQFFGNAAFQKALGYIGLAASVPITLGVLIVGGAIFGAILLGEAVSRRKIIAMITLIVAVVVLSLPETTANETTVSRSAAEILTGSLWAALSGLAYSLFGVTMRMTLQHGFRSNVLMFVSGLTGVITLWSYCAVMLGWNTISRTSPDQWLAMTAAGFLNFSAFVAITASLRLLPVVAVNLINASQVAMAAVAGVILFSEPITVRLAVGIGLTFIGLIILARRTRAPLVITD